MAGLDNLQHIVVLMMENRSFDHMLGLLQSPSYPINGLSGSESNLDSNNSPATVSNDAIYFGDLTPDPGHSHYDVTKQMFDGADPNTTATPSMTGFVKDYGGIANNVANSRRIMKCFSRTKLPILTTLAQQFCVCDNWFSSVPGPTFPNRAFAHAATSIGRVDMSPVGYIGISKTVYELLDENSVSARIFYNDTTLAATFPRLMAKMNTFFGDFQSFLDACSNNSLPAYSFIEPRYNTLELESLLYSASDQHPDHDVHQGERLIQQVFQAIWNNQAVRESTLLVVIYDEHGGLYDHAAPPQRVLNPDGKNWAGASGNPDPPFDFTRLGVRVPAILISPYAQAGSINHTLFDHTSTISTASKVFLKNVPNAFLTQRDKNAATFETVLSLSTPRTEAISFPAQTRATGPALDPKELLLKPLTEHQKGLVMMASHLNLTLPAPQQVKTDPHAVRTEGAAAEYLRQVMSRLHDNAPPTADPGASPTPSHP